MTIQTICDWIELQPEVRDRVLSCAGTGELSPALPYLRGFRDRETMDLTLKHIQEVLGEDEDQIKVLTCMLLGAVDAYGFYRDHGISDNIFTDTMKCFPRFIGECHRMTGKFAFDRAWWTGRQVGCHLFRLGALEYEVVTGRGQPFISIHIPSDADLSERACEASFSMAQEFFSQKLPQYRDWEYRCHSWMLAPELGTLLPATSNILKFQSRFAITARDGENTDYFNWVYHTKNRDLGGLAEDTSLQRNLKAHLLAGGRLSDAEGVLMG